VVERQASAATAASQAAVRRSLLADLAVAIGRRTCLAQAGVASNIDTRGRMSAAKTILVADDEDFLRLLVKETLKQYP
jgi:hypothetical protein